MSFISSSTQEQKQTWRVGSFIKSPTENRCRSRKMHLQFAVMELACASRPLLQNEVMWSGADRRPQEMWGTIKDRIVGLPHAVLKYDEGHIFIRCRHCVTSSADRWAIPDTGSVPPAKLFCKAFPGFTRWAEQMERWPSSTFECLLLLTLLTYNFCRDKR